MTLKTNENLEQFSKKHALADMENQFKLTYC